MYDIFSLRDVKMPEGFLWGSGYAGHQVEGNNTNSGHWKTEQEWEPAPEHEPSGIACNSYKMYMDDVRLVSALGHQAFRTSLEWSRIQPDEHSFSEEAADHYVRFFAALKERGIKVFCTVVHFTVPAWFEEKGGFAKEENLIYFESFLEYIIPKVAPYVDFYNVWNELNLKENKLISLKFHALGYHTIKRYTSSPVSSALAFINYMPFRPNNKMDIAAAKYLDAQTNEYFFHAMRTGEAIQIGEDGYFSESVKNTVDFWSINMYTRTLVDSRRRGGNASYYHKKLKLIDMDFYLEEFYPECMINNLTRLTDKPIYITENGVACKDDRFRIVYMLLHFSALRQCIDIGADVRGFLYWSLLDNYEWRSYIPTFGLCSVDREGGTFERTPKNSAWMYKEIIEKNGFDQELIRKYIHELPSLGL
ncbi:MAG TPA: glycoside hydrolase family 1 protein [Candidatus Ornithomonoglobus intestinigallinarum]|uniref:Glycoside hydrolase family 1 protein n=1 Tax=Candidatus Ornithomonoglobus intestinigallinarum TaxID=2840894 RepID=A0A9D1H3P5_9FIRM|nr:glycoside hydrolase family 1 protein [Candidatus Ornithomonoglobus intestinigallinarum]